MSDTERPGGGPPERESRTDGITIRCEDTDPIERALHEPGVYELGTLEDCARPVETINLKLEVEAIKEGQQPNEYWFRAEVTLRDSFVAQGNKLNIFAAYAEETFHAIPEFNHVGEDQQYIFMSNGGYNYLLWLDGQKGSIQLQTLGIYDGEHVPVPTDSLSRETDIFEVAFDDFLNTSEDMLDLLYDAYDRRAGRKRLEIGLSERRPFGNAGNGDHLPGEAHSTDLVITGEIKSNVLPTLDDIVGLDYEKRKLYETVIAFQNPEIMRKWGVEDGPSGIFLYGPPGTGKTTLAKAVAGELGAELIEVSADKIYGKWMGESEKNFAALLDKVENYKEPIVLLFDELDGILFDNGSASYRAVQTLFKQRIPQIPLKNPKAVIIATSNKSEHIDPALLRDGRFDVKLYIPLPKPAELRAIFGKVICGYLDNKQIERTIFEGDLGDIDLVGLAEAASDWSGAQVVGLIRSIVRARGVQEILSGEVPAPLTHNELLHAIRERRQG